MWNINESNYLMRAVVLCGGVGSRLWPESRESLPKQFIPIFKEKSLLDLTIERILCLKFDKKPIFISSKKHGFLVQKSVNKYNLKADIILEPEGKNTCAAIYLAAKHASLDDNLLIMPSDHFIPEIKKFSDYILNNFKNLPLNIWVTLGIKPSKPSEAYGYIETSDIKNNNFQKVTKFIEKPTKNIAVKLIKKNNYYWNAGIFITNATNAINSIKTFAPEIAEKCDKAYEKLEKNNKTNEINFLDDLFSLIPSESIDYAVMEKEQNIYLSKLNCIWSDFGSWDSISEIIKYKSNNDNIIEIDSSKNFIRNKNRVIATLGVKDLIIVDSDNATLIVKKGYSEKVKLIVNKLANNNVLEAKEHPFEDRPWGRFENLFVDKHCKVKRLVVSPYKRLSLQFHNHRSEHWLIVSGTANIYLNGQNIVLSENQSINIPMKSHHYIENKQDHDLIIIETQTGSYFGEDDIIRLDDPYSR